MNFKNSELRKSGNNLLRKIQRGIDKENKKSPFIPTPEKEFLKLLREELEKDPLQPKNTRLNLYKKRGGR